MLFTDERENIKTRNEVRTMLKILNSMLYAALTSSKLRIAHVLLQTEAHEVGRPDNAFDEVTDTRTIVIFKWQFSVSVLVKSCLNVTNVVYIDSWQVK